MVCVRNTTIKRVEKNFKSFSSYTHRVNFKRCEESKYEKKIELPGEKEQEPARSE